MTRNRIFYIGLSFVATVVLFWFLLSQIDVNDLKITFARIDRLALLGFMAVSLTAGILRAVRYKWLLHPEPIAFGKIFLVTLIRNLFVDLLPARIGSLSYIYILNKRLNFLFETAASTFVVAFVFDFLTLSPFLVLSIFAVGIGSSSVSSSTFLIASLLFFLAVFFIIWKLVPLFHFALRILNFLFKLFHAQERSFAQTTNKKVRLTIKSLGKIQERRIYWPLFLLSLAMRFAKYASLHVLLFSLLRSHGFGLRDLSLWKTILGITGAEFTSVLPIKGLGGFGTWESAWALTFKLMNFDPGLAIISGIGVHVITNLFEYALGILSILILALPFIKNRRKPPKTP